MWPRVQEQPGGLRAPVCNFEAGAVLCHGRMGLWKWPSTTVPTESGFQTSLKLRGWIFPAGGKHLLLGPDPKAELLRNHESSEGKNSPKFLCCLPCNTHTYLPTQVVVCMISTN